MFLFFLLLFQSTVFYLASQRETWGDEGHFVNTVRYFGTGLTIDKVRHYNEMSGPLPFMLYAAWGNLFGFDLNTLRLLSLILSLILYVTFCYLLFLITQNEWSSIVGTVFLVLHPYMIGLSAFVFTDLLPILASVVALTAMYKKRYVLFLFALIVSLLSRQYFVFFIGAVIIFYTFNYIQTKSREYLLMLLAAGLSVVPLILLMILWQGASPQNVRTEMYLGEAYRFHLSYLNLYVAQISIYMLPYLVWRRKIFYSSKTILWISLFISFIYFFGPVEPCKAALQHNVSTVGYFHKLIVISGIEPFRHVIFYISFLFALPVILTMLRNIFNQISTFKSDPKLFYELAFFMFFLIMPFSYLVWEKYFMPLVPLFVIYFIIQNPEGRKKTIEFR